MAKHLMFLPQLGKRYLLDPYELEGDVLSVPQQFVRAMPIQENGQELDVMATTNLKTQLLVHAGRALP
jgi:hypothetical protein